MAESASILVVLHGPYPPTLSIQPRVLGAYLLTGKVWRDRVLSAWPLEAAVAAVAKRHRRRVGGKRNGHSTFLLRRRPNVFVFACLQDFVFIYGHYLFVFEEAGLLTSSERPMLFPATPNEPRDSPAVARQGERARKDRGRGEGEDVEAANLDD